jgi:hypothetical protein
MKMAKVFHTDGAAGVAAGWYYQIDMAQPRGPFATKAEALRVLLNDPAGGAR